MNHRKINLNIVQELMESYEARDDFSMDERGEIPADVKRGVLSEDGIYNMLERNREILEMLGEE